MVLSNDQWLQVYAEVAALAQQHRTTLVFVNTRRMAERVAHRLTEVLGDEVVVRPGERFPVDGEVLDGSSHADEALITGESLPVTAEAGTALEAGAMNLTGVLDIEVTNTADKSFLAEVRAMMEELTPLVEPLSIDEAFLDLTGTERLHKDTPARTLARFARRVEDEIGISVSVGLSYCKFLAKVASDLEKPRGFSVIGEAEALDFLARQKVTLIWGVGKAFAAKLERDGITRIGQLQSMDETALMKRYGVMGRRLFHLSRGHDTRHVEPRGGAKSISHETTFNDDHGDAATLVPVLRSLTEKVSARLKAKGLAGKTVTLKLKDREFRSKTRNRQLSDPTQLADRIFRAALPLLEDELDGTQYRLLGVGVADFAHPALADPDDLVDIEATRRAKAERAIDALRGKFGDRAVETGYTFGTGHRGRPQRDG